MARFMRATHIVASGVISSFTDWFFMGVLFHDRYQKYPDTW